MQITIDTKSQQPTKPVGRYSLSDLTISKGTQSQKTNKRSPLLDVLPFAQMAGIGK